MRVPHKQLQPDTLRRVIESFVNREGTDYGEHERSLDDKVADVMRQLDEGSVVLTWDANSETVNIVPTSQLEV